MIKKIRFALIGAASAVVVCAASFAAPISAEEITSVPSIEAEGSMQNEQLEQPTLNDEAIVKQTVPPKSSVSVSITPSQHPAIEHEPMVNEYSQDLHSNDDSQIEDLAEQVPAVDQEPMVVEEPQDVPSDEDSQTEDPAEQVPAVEQEPIVDDNPVDEEPAGTDNPEPTGTRENPSREDINVLIQHMDTDVLDVLFEGGAVYTPSQFISEYVKVQPDFQGVIDTYYD